MNWFFDVFAEAFHKILSADALLLEIVSLTLQVSLTALVISVILALPTAAFLATRNGPLTQAWIVILNALMGLPPVLVGLLVYMLLSHRGPLGFLQWLFTPSAMIAAQTILIFPIVCALFQQHFRLKYQQLHELFYSLQISPAKRMQTVIIESRFELLSATVTGLGRGLAEVGAVMLVGGNILHHTRTITTTIALETSKGEIALAVSLGIILLFIALTLNAALFFLHQRYQPKVIY